MNENPILRAIDISHSYRALKVLDTINLDCHRSEIIAILGVNGAGKSSFLNILTGITVPTKGDIYIDDKNLFKSTYSIKKRIGYLSENNPLYEDMYVKEYLEYVARIYLNKDEIKDRIHLIIRQVGLTGEYKKKISILSKGNRQRVGLAQTLIHDPDIIILDEPMTGLDLHQQIEIKKLISDLQKDKLIILSSHHFAEFDDLASRYLILHRGKLVFDKKTSDMNSNIENIFNDLTQ